MESMNARCLSASEVEGGSKVRKGGRAEKCKGRHKCAALFIEHPE
jgi:hypothetical protein